MKKQGKLQDGRKWFSAKTIIQGDCNGKRVKDIVAEFYDKKVNDGNFAKANLLKKDEIKELQDKKLPIRINDWDTIRGARVVYVHPFGFMTIVMMQTPGFHEIKEFIGA